MYSLGGTYYCGKVFLLHRVTLKNHAFFSIVKQIFTSGHCDQADNQLIYTKVKVSSLVMQGEGEGGGEEILVSNVSTCVRYRSVHLFPNCQNDGN